MSPFIHNRLFALQGRDSLYGKQDISPEDLSVAASTIYRVLEIMKSLDITAYKEKRKEKEENE